MPLVHGDLRAEANRGPGDRSKRNEGGCAAVEMSSLICSAMAQTGLLGTSMEVCARSKSCPASEPGVSFPLELIARRCRGPTRRGLNHQWRLF
jgi:hypothetical protein